MSDKNNQDSVLGESENAYGSIRISEEALATIISMAAAQISGVAAMSGSKTAELTEKLGKKNLSKGVKVELEGHEVGIALYILAEYGVNIPELALSIQKEVKRTVETTTTMKVKEINVFVQGIVFDHINETASGENPVDEKTENEG